MIIANNIAQDSNSHNKEESKERISIGYFIFKTVISIFAIRIFFDVLKK